VREIEAAATERRVLTSFSVLNSSTYTDNKLAVKSLFPGSAEIVSSHISKAYRTLRKRQCVEPLSVSMSTMHIIVSSLDLFVSLTLCT